MKLISHRGNIVGPNPSRENSPSYIDTAISAGYDVEIDVNVINGVIYLGHDTPDYEVTKNWLIKRKDKLWIHCKNLEAATILSGLDVSLQLFCHTADPFVLTSNGYIWVHDLKLNLTNRTIIPLLNEDDIYAYHGKIVYGVCTDFITLAEYNLKQKGLYR
jgi:hypothetical protein